jgi:hypothetical protein
MKTRIAGLLRCVLGTALLSGCFTTQPVSLEALEKVDRLVEVQIVTRQQREFRGIVGLGFVGPETLRYLPLRYGPKNWMVRFAGWPAVYTAGKYLRHQVDDDMQEIPRAEIQRIYIEKYSWWLTLLSLPVTLPPGLIDFLFYNVTFGFENVDTRFDTFSRPPAGPPSVGEVKDLPPP